MANIDRVGEDCWIGFTNFFTETIPETFQAAWDATALWVDECVIPFFESCKVWFEENADWLWPVAVAFVAGAAIMTGIVLACLPCEKEKEKSNPKENKPNPFPSNKLIAEVESSRQTTPRSIRPPLDLTGSNRSESPIFMDPNSLSLERPPSPPLFTTASTSPLNLGESPAERRTPSSTILKSRSSSPRENQTPAGLEPLALPNSTTPSSDSSSQIQRTDSKGSLHEEEVIEVVLDPTQIHRAEEKGEDNRRTPPPVVKDEQIETLDTVVELIPSAEPKDEPNKKGRGPFHKLVKTFSSVGRADYKPSLHRTNSEATIKTGSRFSFKNLFGSEDDKK